MAPTGRRRNDGEGAESQAVHELGVRGRKTGVALANTGKLDEHGFQPLDDVWSSPQKGAGSANNDDDEDEDEDQNEEEEDDTGSEDMELADPSSAGPGPRTLLKNQRNLQYPLPRSRSPLKTGLTSPARRNPRLSSPLREDRDATVTRKLDFAAQPRKGGRPNGANGVLEEEEEEEEDEEEGEEEEEEEEEQEDDEEDVEPGDQSDVDVGEPVDDPQDGLDMIDDEPQFDQPLDDDNQYSDEDEEEEVVEAPVEKAPAKGRGRPKKTVPGSGKDQDEQPPSSQKKRGRPPKKDKQADVEAPATESPAGSRKRRSASEVEAEQPEDESRQAKRQKTQKQPAKKTASAATNSEPKKPRGRPGRKPKQIQAEDEDAGESSFMALQKGPPMPKRRGLVSVKRPNEIHQTRSGRHSYKPLHWWAGEEVIAEEEEQHDMFTNDDDFVLKSLKEVRRVEEEDTRPRKAPKSRGRPKTAKAPLPAVEEGPELEEWEINPGTVVDEIINWEPEHETHPPGDDDQVHFSEEQIAISGDAVQTREIRDATFRFGKTLTMPFMGAGVVDLPPGSEKRPKNSRKMHMVFFVHYGKVAVTVNEGSFRISAGGQWFVPRGNYYGIMNDYEKPARIFFAQACEVASQNAETSQLLGA